MGLWEKMKNGVQGNDGVVMDYPHHIRRAFAWVGVSENPYGEVQLSNRGRAMALFSLAAGYLNAYERYDLLFWALMEDEGLSTDLTNVWKEQIGVSDQEIQKCFAALEELWQTLFQLVWWTKYED